MSAIHSTARKRDVTVHRGFPHVFTVTCNNCGQEWAPMLRSGGRLPWRWWGCPTSGCNVS